MFMAAERKDLYGRETDFSAPWCMLVVSHRGTTDKLVSPLALTPDGRLRRLGVL